MALLRGMSLFQGLGEADLREIAAACAPRWIDDGAYLFHAEEAADRIYLVAEGQLEVVRQGPDGRTELLLNTLGPGQTVGEIAVVRGEPRSASVRARGRAQVYALDAAAFMGFLRRFPEIAIAIARITSHNLVRAERRALAGGAVPLWVVRTDGGLEPDLGAALARVALRYLDFEARPRQVALFATGAAPRDEEVRQVRLRHEPLGARPGPELVGQVAAARSGSALVVVAGPLAAVEGVLARCTGFVSAPGERPPALAEGARWIRIIESGLPSAAAVRADAPDPAGSVARQLLGRSVGVALGGGGALGLAHLGALQALAELGVPVDFVAGTSMGAVVGAFYLSLGLGRTMELISGMTRPQDWARLFLDPAVLTTGMITGHRIQRWIEAHVAETFERLPIPFGIIATDMESWDEVVLREGRLGDAVRASLAIPGVFTPHAFQPPGSARVRKLVDGGSVNNVPVDIARALGAHRVIGVHVLGHRRGESVAGEERGLANRVVNRIPAVSRLRAVMQAQFRAMARSGERQVFTADVAIVPDTKPYLVSDFWKGPELARIGRQTALEVAEQLRVLAP